MTLCNFVIIESHNSYFPCSILTNVLYSSVLSCENLWLSINLRKKLKSFLQCSFLSLLHFREAVLLGVMTQAGVRGTKSNAHLSLKDTHFLHNVSILSLWPATCKRHYWDFLSLLSGTQGKCLFYRP